MVIRSDRLRQYVYYLLFYSCSLWKLVSFPFMFNAIIQYKLENFNSPVSLDMKWNMYVDTVIPGADTEKSAVSLLSRRMNHYKRCQISLTLLHFKLLCLTRCCDRLVQSIQVMKSILWVCVGIPLLVPSH